MATDEIHAEVAFDLADSGEELRVASPEALAAGVGAEHSAAGDLLAEGYTPARFPARGEVIPEAGTAMRGGEFLPLLGAAVKALPSLAAAIGRELAEPAVQAIEAMPGDDRVRIRHTTRVPWRRFCALRIEFPTGRRYRGTGFLIGARTVATAGDCVYLHGQGGWPHSIEVIPACDGKEQPFGSAWAASLRSTVGWTQDKVARAGYGAIVLPPEAFTGMDLDGFAVRRFDAEDLLAQRVVVAGYPGDKPFAELWGTVGVIKVVTAATLVCDADAMAPAGAPVYLKHDGKRQVVGVHTGEAVLRVTAPMAANLERWGTL